MTNRSRRKSGRKEQKLSEELSIAPPTKELSAESATNPVTVVKLEFPPPDWLAEEAAKEVSQGLMEDYMETIRILREDKRFSFREIAEWLEEHGVPADHNAVYRAYRKLNPEVDGAEGAEES